jgi:hypothetical protein
MIRPQRLEEESREPELSKITEIASGEFAASRLAGTPRSLDKREQTVRDARTCRWRSTRSAHGT